MKFTCIPNLGKEGGGVVWDGEANKALARFDKNGEFETSDRKVIEKLKARGFKVVESDEKPDDADLDLLKARATELGIEFSPNIGAKTLASRIAEAVEANESNGE